MGSRSATLLMYVYPWLASKKHDTASVEKEAAGDATGDDLRPLRRFPKIYRRLRQKVTIEGCGREGIRAGERNIAGATC